MRCIYGAAEALQVKLHAARELENFAHSLIGTERSFVMEYEEDIKKLESNVGRLLDSLDTAQDDRRKLKAEITRLELGKKELEEEVKRLKDEKKSIHQRVSGLISSIEKWEKSSPVSNEHPVPPGVAVTGSKGPGTEPVQGVLVGN